LGAPNVGFKPLSKRTTPNELINAQVETADWLTSLGVTDSDQLIDDVQQQRGREAFLKQVTPATADEQRHALLQLASPTAVRHLVTMLTAYDWAFIDCAKEIRGYTVAKIIEDTQLEDPRHRLRALELLGKVTEVGLFTERVEITKIDMTDEALEAKIRAKLDKFRHVIDVTDAIEHTAQEIAADEPN
jgi:hypothetical protein